jgi:hypothetical protein
VAQGVGPEFKPQFCKKRKEIKGDINKLKENTSHVHGLEDLRLLKCQYWAGDMAQVVEHLSRKHTHTKRC